jgi:hypothetical protein
VACGDKNPHMRNRMPHHVAVVLAGFFAASTLLACVEQEDDKPSDEDLAVAKQNILTTAPTPRYPVNADLDGKVVYLGLDANPAPVEPGKDLTLTHYWKVVAQPGEGWRIFTHVEAPNKQNYMNADHPPVQGKYPLTAWKAGQIIRDTHTVKVPEGWPAQSLLVHVGLWRGASRMPIKSGPSDPEGRVIAATIAVQGKPKEEPRKRYVARQAAKAPKIDGKLDEAVWGSAPSTGQFVNTMTGAPVPMKTEAKILWDKKFLYIGIENADDDVWGKLDKRDDKLWTEEAAEIMIDADGNGRSYVELQVSPNGTIFDSYLPERRKYEDTVDPKMKPFGWNGKINAKVRVDGTLNKREDQDKGWTVELAIPLEDVKGLDAKSAVKVPPSPGDTWRLNFFRMDIPKGKPQQAAAWSPPMVGDFHALDRFGEVVFGDAQGNTTAPVAEAPKDGKDGKDGKGKGKETSAVGGAAAPSDRKATASAKAEGGAKKK